MVLVGNVCSSSDRVVCISLYIVHMSRYSNIDHCVKSCCLVVPIRYIK